MATKYEFYTPETDGQYFTWGVNWNAMTFKVGHKGTNEDHIATSVKLRLNRAGTPPGIFTVSIRATDGSNRPTGADLASGTTDPTTLPAFNNSEIREITFSSGVLLRKDTRYAIVIRLPSGTNVNMVGWRRLSTGGGADYAEGKLHNSADSGSSWTANTPDQWFEVWGNPQGSGEGGSIFPSDTVARVSSIRHIFRPGFFRMQVGLGDLGFDVDIAELTVRKALDTVKEVKDTPTAGVGYPEILEVLGMTAEEFAEQGRKLAIGRHLEFPAYEEQIAYEEWFQKQMEELRRIQE